MPPFAVQFASPGPILIQLGPISLRWYGLLIATAVLIGVGLSSRLARLRKLDPTLVGDLIVWVVLGAIPMARLYYVAFEWSQYARDPAEIFAIWNGGIAIHGAIIGGLIATWLFCRVRRVSFWQVVDILSPSLILGQAIGRWGNFFNSEAFGGPTNLPWKLYIPPERRPPLLVNFEYFHPTFLYESLWNLGVFALLLSLFWWGYRRPGRLKPGTLLFVYCIAYSLGRLWIEGLRMDSLMWGPLRIAQVVSLGAIALGAFGLVWLYGLRRRLPDVVTTVERDARV
jgi:phosphatidylglycerol:prolipoprotein diacylglycerol transferase